MYTKHNWGCHANLVKKRGREVKFRLIISRTEEDLKHTVFPRNEISLKAELG